MCIGFLARRIRRMVLLNSEVKWGPFWLFWKRVVFSPAFYALLKGWHLGSEFTFSVSLLVYLAFVWHWYVFGIGGSFFWALPLEAGAHNMHPRGGFLVACPHSWKEWHSNWLHLIMISEFPLVRILQQPLLASPSRCIHNFTRSIPQSFLVASSIWSVWPFLDDFLEWGICWVFSTCILALVFFSGVPVFQI